MAAFVAAPVVKADQTDVKVQVGSYYGIVSETYNGFSNLDLGTIDPAVGTSGEDAIGLWCHSNHGQKWILTITGTGISLDDLHVVYLPLTHYQVQVFAQGAGSLLGNLLPNTYANLTPDAATDIYQADPTEYNTSGVKIGVKIRINGGIASTQPKGTYWGKLIYTMYDPTI
jgi:hypothetical protein